MSITEGNPAPQFQLEDADGTHVSLSDFRGKHLVLYFYPKDNTSGCTKEACGFRDLWKEIEDLGVVVIGVSPDKPDSHRRFINQFQLPFRLLSDPERIMMTAYEAYGEKTLYGKKTLGVIRSTVWIDPDGLVNKHWKKVAKAEEHPNKVLEALRSRLAHG